MKSSVLGKNTSKAEVQDITRHGVWLLVNKKEYFLPYAEYPWFKAARVADVYDLKLEHGTHLHWPALDVDLEIESIERPENYPLVAGSRKAVPRP